MAKNEISDYDETDSGNTDISGITLSDATLIDALDNIARAQMGALKRWFKSSLFRLRDSTDQTKLLAFDLSGLATGTTRTLTLQDASGTLALIDNLRGYISGLTLSNNTTDAANDIDIASGSCINSSNTDIMTLNATLTKRLDAAWAVGSGNGGLDTGSVANATYHVFLIKRTDTGVVDALFSLSLTAPTLPSGYSPVRRIGSIVRTGGAIKGFSQLGDRFTWNTPVNDISAVNPGTSAVTRALTVPLGIAVFANVVHTIATGTTSATYAGLLSSFSNPDVAPTTTLFDVTVATLPTAGNYRGAVTREVLTDTSGQIRSRLNLSDASTVELIHTLGWTDRRGA